MSPAGAHAELVPAARLFGRLLVRELDAPTIAELHGAGVAAALREVGVEPPRATIDELAAAYAARFLHPARARPPVQSLWVTGHYDGDAAVAVRGIAKAAGRELAEGARGAAPDHLGCILLLWSELVHERPELAERLRRDHLTWAPAALAAVVGTADFYGLVASAAARLVQRLCEPAS
ncbi:MAG TPA: molecular chaperone TorD family protein [Planctomycetota bacterium]|nr:molecular chaperone TorD family protein [Planctomycetota bacterium]